MTQRTSPESTETGAEMIATERQRQIDAEGWTPEHDDEHDCGELAVQAINLIAASAPGVDVHHALGTLWPNWKHPKTYPDDVRRLVIAGALIAAEIDRLQRRAGKP